MSKENVIETVNEAIDAWGLGYAIETKNLDSEDLMSYPELAEQVLIAYTAMRKIKSIVEE